MKAMEDVAPLIANDKYAYLFGNPNLWLILNFHFFRILSAEAVGMVSSVVSSSQLPDPSESGLFDAPLKPRQRSYQLLDFEHT